MVASNIICNGTQMGIRIKSRRGRGGGVEHVRFDNWTMENVGQGINVTNHYVMAGETRNASSPVDEKTPVFRDIVISHVTIARSRVAIDVEGLPEMPIDGLHLFDIAASVKTGLKAYNTIDLELHNVRLEADSKNGPVFLIRDSKDLELDNVSTSKPAAEYPVVRLDNCPGAFVHRSRASGYRNVPFGRATPRHRPRYESTERRPAAGRRVR